jgi:UMF1 family MFS transporter
VTISSGSAREQAGWYVYDWANSAFATTVVTVFAGPYLTTITRSVADADGYVYPFGVPVAAGAFFPFLVSFSVVLQVVCLPLVGGIADSTHRKKHLLALFAYVGALATIGLAFVDPVGYLLAGLLFVIANLSLGASIVVYNAFLPEIAPPDERDRVSSHGWALGYVGGGVLLALNLLLISQTDRLGLTTGQAVRISLASAGVWWAAFTLVPLATLRSHQPRRQPRPGEHVLTMGFNQLRQTLGEARRYRQTVIFLAAYLLFNDGVQTVIVLSSQFGQEELGLSLSTLTAVILMVQFVACGGALLFNVLAGRIGAKRSISVSLVVWTATLVYAYALLHTTLDFFILAAVIALVLGGTQALSRSLYSLLIPRGQEAAYFGLYEISDKGTSWLGPLLFGLALQFTGSYRVAILSLAVFFGLGLLLLGRVNVAQGVLEAGNEAPPLQTATSSPRTRNGASAS